MHFLKKKLKELKNAWPKKKAKYKYKNMKTLMNTRKLPFDPSIHKVMFPTLISVVIKDKYNL